MDRAKDHDGGREYWNSWRERSFADADAAAVLWRYHHRPAEELYDLAVDPNERRNLAGEPRAAEILETLRASLSSWRRQQGDEKVGPEPLPEPLPEPAD